jgi:conjugative transfer region protein TrbK
MTPRITAAMAARAAALAFLLVAIAATAIQFRHGDRKPAEGSTALPAAVDADPLRAELAHCQTLGEAGAHDAGCLHAWAENRRRFLGGGTRPSEPSSVEMFPSARTSPSVATGARLLDQPTPKDER